MGLKLTYAERSLLWAELVNTAGERVFVQTDEAHKPGTKVTLEVVAPDFPTPLMLTCIVQGLRTVTQTLPAGVFVNLEPASVETCRVAIGAVKAESVRIAGRKEIRADCSLPARILTPRLIENCMVKSLSTNGFTLTGAGIVLKGSTVKVEISLKDGMPAELDAEVIWVRPELGLAGFRHAQLSPAVGKRITDAINALGPAKIQEKSTGVTVLVADDDPSILDFAFRALSKFGHRVLRADRGDTALAMIREERPKLVLLDVLMPGLDGLEVCKAIRSDDMLCETPIVLLSAMGEARLKEAARAAQANDYLIKPMHLATLRDVVRKYTGATDPVVVP